MTAAATIYRSKKKSGRKKLKKNVKVKLLVFTILALSAVIAYFPISAKVKKHLHPVDVGVVHVDRYKDLNELHLKHAKANGIAAFKSDKEFLENSERLVDEGKLVHIKNPGYYTVKKLTHSHPFLTPQAADLLDDIGKRFHQKLSENNLGKCYFQVSSLLRTGESQKRLSRSNTNASSNSSHLYGTTFDISYQKVIKKPLFGKTAEVIDGPAMKLLSETLGELRKEGRLVVVTERKEACFHITVVE